MAIRSSLKPVGELLADSWKLYKKHMNVLALIGVIPFIFEGAKMLLTPGFAIEYGFPLWITILMLIAVAIFAILSFVFNLVTPLALLTAIDEGSRSKKLDPSQVYKTVFSNFIQYLFVLMLLSIVCIGGSVLLIIPGIVVGVYANFALFAFLFEDKHGMDALVASAWYVRDLWWAIFGRNLFLLFVLFVASYIFVVIAACILIYLGFSLLVFGIIFQLFLSMIIGPFAVTYVYCLYKDVKSIKGTKVPEKGFAEEAEKIFIVLLVVATAALLMFFFVATISPRGVVVRGQSFGNTSYSNSAITNSLDYQISSSGMMYRHHTRVFINY